MELNPLSEFMFELTVLITAILHIILPRSLEPAAGKKISFLSSSDSPLFFWNYSLPLNCGLHQSPKTAAFMIGNLFAIYVFPFSFLYAIFWFFDVVYYLPGVLLVYLIAILMDSSHLRAPDNDK
jgi:hypothetical protein